MTERPESEYERGFKAGRKEAAAYDSRPDTYAHIQMVQRLGFPMVADLIRRLQVHDASKLVDPEKSAYDGLPLKLEGLTYGSPEYRAQLRDPAIKGHQRNNDHHPEAHANGIHDMDLIHLLEMILDWTAASRRMTTGNIYRSIEQNRERFNYGPEIEGLLRRTVDTILEREAIAYPAYRLASVDEMMAEGAPSN